MTEWIISKIDTAIDIGKDIIEEKKVEDSKKKNIYVPSIKERLQDT